MSTLKKVTLSGLIITLALAMIMPVSAVIAGTQPKLVVKITKSTPSAQEITTPAADVELVHLKLKNKNLNKSFVQKMTFSIETDLPSEALLNFRLTNPKGKVLAGPASLETYHNTVTFNFAKGLKVKNSRKVVLKVDVSGVTSNGLLRADIFPANQVIASKNRKGTKIIKVRPKKLLSGNVMIMIGEPQVQPALKVEVSPNRPTAAQFVAGTTGNTMMSYKFTALNEDVQVDRFYVATTSPTAQSDVERIKLYLNGNQIGSPNGYILDSGGDAWITLAPGTFVVPENSSVTLTIKVDLTNKPMLTDAATLEIGLGDADGDDSDWGVNGMYAQGNYSITAVGKQSGQDVDQSKIDSVGDGTGNIAGSYVHYLYDGILTVTLNSSSPSGSATPGVGKGVLRLDLTATGDDITIYNLETVMSGTAYISGTYPTYWKSVDGAVTYATFPAGTAWLRPGTDFDVLGDDSDECWDELIRIAAGTTKTIKLIGDTTGATTNTTLQALVTGSADTVSGVSWMNNSLNRVDSVLTKNLPVYGGVLVY